eukprot:Nitzschia sp. Nitz4//scaffold28_size193895//111689//112609//NITZ4_001666-RA/size193895-processed-gene-0.70-mRNA-1//-1//CDS//3329545985//7936//frame0
MAKPTRKRKAEASTETKPAKKEATSTFSAVCMILSPSKTMDLDVCLDKDQPLPWTTPSCDMSKTKRIVQVMKDHAKSSTKLAKLLSISAKLAATAQQYWDDHTLEGGQPSGFSFSGAVFQGLQISTLSKPSLDYLQDSLRIVDPVYGFLRPMDVIQPYRLEMGTKNVLGTSGGTLQEFWKPSIVETIESMTPDPTDRVVLINLASDEYASAVLDLKPKKKGSDGDIGSTNEKMQIVKIIFRHGGRVIAIHAKRARGMFARYCAENQVKDLDDLEGFDLEGYTFQEKSKEKDGTITYIFDRPKDWKA